MSEKTNMRRSQSKVHAGRHAVRRLTPPGVLAAVVLAFTAVACNPDHILKVDDPDVAQPSQLSGKESLPTQLAGALGDFQVAYSGTGNGPEGLVNIGGLLTDEFEFTESFPTRIVVD